jgi:hypothetical protein
MLKVLFVVVLDDDAAARKFRSSQQSSDIFSSAKMDMLQHTPPSLPRGSLEPPKFKRARGQKASLSSSISGRLRSASDLCDEGFITSYQKGVLKVSVPCSICLCSHFAGHDH